MTSKTKTPRSLVQFVRDERRKDCKICALPPEVRAQVSQANERKINVAVRVKWLLEDYGISVTRSDFEVHGRGNHDAIDQG